MKQTEFCLLMCQFILVYFYQSVFTVNSRLCCEQPSEKSPLTNFDCCVCCLHKLTLLIAKRE